MYIENEGHHRGKTLHLEWSAASLKKEGEQYCGDRYLVKEFGKKVLIAAIDGVGHGKRAEEVAHLATKTLEGFQGESLITLVRRCHETLKGTRGVVMSLAMFDSTDHTMSWISVGNVEGVLLKADGKKKNKNIILRGGIVGYSLPSLQASIFPVSPGDLLILTTDGVKDEYIGNVSVHSATDDIVTNISSKYFKRSDDALILAARYNRNGTNT